MAVVNHLLSSSLSLWRGTHVRHAAAGGKPPQPMQLYDIENCPFCRLVREALTELDLDVIIYPCPKGGERFRSRLIAMGGREQFPYLVDPNTARALYESRDIIHYLFKQYGSGQVPKRWRLMGLNKLTSALGTLSRMGAGLFARPSKRPELLLELYSFESSPYARPVRERLCELELPYVLRNLGKGHWEDYLLPNLRKRYRPNYKAQTVNRAKLLTDTGRIASPYLVDPNTSVALYESGDIIAYLNAQYAL